MINPYKHSPIICECGKPIDDTIVKKKIIDILIKWRNTPVLEAGNFQQFLLKELGIYLEQK